MTTSSSLRMNALRFLVTASLAAAAVAVGQQPLPTPRYQSPGLEVPQAPAPQQFPLPQAITPNGTVVEDVIVRVNDQIISRSDLERAQVTLQQEIAQNPNLGDVSERQKNLLRDLIDQQLLISKAKELGVNPDAEVIRRLDEIRKQYGLPSMEALEQAARKQGVSFEDFKANIRNSVMTQSVVRDEVGRTIRMTHADEMKYYEAHKEEFNRPEQIKLAEILIPTPANPEDAAVEASKKKADEVYARLKGGEDFAAVAKEVSGGPTAAQGGDLGVFKRGQLAKVLEDKTFALNNGEFTEPIRTRQGFVILRTVEHQQAGVPPLESIENEVQNAMYQEQIQPALRAYLTKLRDENFVEPAPGFVDAGASGKEAKPVYASYVAPTAKKKTIAKRRLKAKRDAARLEKAGLMVKGSKAVPIPPVKLDKHGKPKKVKRQKVRFGQAPETSLPDASEAENTTVASGTATPSASGQDALGTAETNPAIAAQANGTEAPGSQAAPGTQVAPVDSNNTVSAEELEEQEAKQVKQKKTRFSSHAVEVKKKQDDKGIAKVLDRVKATPDGPSAEEKQAAALQSSALGLQGDTTKKKKKRKKGEAKERLQTKEPEKKPGLVDNGLPDRLHQVNGPEQTSGTPSASSASGNPPAQNSKEAEQQRRGKEPVTDPTSDATALPSANQPAPGSTTPAQTPSENGVTPSSNTPRPQTSDQPQ